MVASRRLGRAHLGQHRLGRGHAQRVAVVRAEVQHLAAGDLVHALLRATERAERQAAADALGRARRGRAARRRAPVAPPHPAVMPVFTSSKISIVPYLRVISRTACR